MSLRAVISANKSITHTQIRSTYISFGIMMSATPNTSSHSCPEYRQIRAVYDEETITVYQAYSAEIALPAVTNQSLSASPAFQLSRMTWIKPSFMWMMYRSGFSYKDSRQAHILSLRLKRSTFESLLQKSSVTSNKQAFTSVEKNRAVRVQWDPERSIRIGKLSYRSIQVGIGRDAVPEYLAGIVDIQDITETARKLKTLLDEGKIEEAGKLVPTEEIYPLPQDLRNWLRMDVDEVD